MPSNILIEDIDLPTFQITKPNAEPGGEPSIVEVSADELFVEWRRLINVASDLGHTDMGEIMSRCYRGMQSFFQTHYGLSISSVVAAAVVDKLGELSESVKKD